MEKNVLFVQHKVSQGYPLLIDFIRCEYPYQLPINSMLPSELTVVLLT